MTTVRCAKVEDVTAVAQMHAERIGGGFLATLGTRFLERLYRRMVLSERARVFVADDDEDDVAGFVATTRNTNDFYKEFVRRDGLAAATAGAGSILRAPKQVWETLRYGTGDGHDLPAAEVLAIAVASHAAGRGIGVALLERALEGFRQDGVSAARVVTAVGNDPAVRMYERAGFRPHSRTEVHAGVAQEVLVWP
jgi:ribosomal protein S18 acetylase RimI-like enzyme